MCNTNTTKKTGVFENGKQFLPLMGHPSCYSYNQCMLDTIMRNKHTYPIYCVAENICARDIKMGLV